LVCSFFFFQAEDGIRDFHVTGVQTCALPICLAVERSVARPAPARSVADVVLERALELEAAVLVPVAIEAVALAAPELAFVMDLRSEEHTSELQSRENLVCRLLLEQKKSPNAR